MKIVYFFLFVWDRDRKGKEIFYREYFRCLSYQLLRVGKMYSTFKQIQDIATKLILEEEELSKYVFSIK